MKLRFVLSLVAILLGTQVMNAQILERISKDIKRQVERKVERGIEDSVDDALDDAEDQIKGKNKRDDRNKRGEYPNSEPEVVVVKEIPPYSFSGDMIIDIETNGWMEDNMIKVVADDYQLGIRPMLVKMPNNLMVHHRKEESLTKINNKKFEGQALKEFFTFDRIDDTELEKTDEIEDINGYIARKYIVDGDGFKGEAWISPEIDLDYDLFQNLMEYRALGIGTQYGFPLKLNIEFNTGDTFNFTVQDINTESPDYRILDVSEYELIDMTDLKSGN